MKYAIITLALAVSACGGPQRMYPAGGSDAPDSFSIADEAPFDFTPGRFQ